MAPRIVLILISSVALRMPASAVGAPAKFWLSTSDAAPINVTSPQLELALGSTTELFIWYRPATLTNLRNFSLNVACEQSGVDLVDGTFAILNSANLGVERFEYITDSNFTPPLLSEFTEADVVAGDADILFNLQGFTLFPSATVAGIGPLCDRGELNCVLATDSQPAFLLGSFSVKGVTASATVEMHLQIGDFGMNQLLYSAGDYDFDGEVAAADHGIWAANFGFTANPAADGNANGTIDAADYPIWRDRLGGMAVLQPTSDVLVHFGADSTPGTPQETYDALNDRSLTLAGDEPDAVIQVSGPGAGMGQTVIPEPSTVFLAVFALTLRTLHRTPRS